MVSHTYTVKTAARRLGLAGKAVIEAVRERAIPSFVDPEGEIRIPASHVEVMLTDEGKWEEVAGFTRLKARQISLVSGFAYSTIRSRLKKAGLSTIAPTWKDVRGRWNLPASLKTFNALYKERFPVWLNSVLESKAESEQRLVEEHREKQEKTAQEIEKLRGKLLKVFPTWESDRRPNQQVTLHLGPTNSGKTFQALSELMNAGSGWYLSPLRLLAYEVYETLNRKGVRCSLLTGEESIPVEGASVTASTIEMFDPSRSGNCVVIDEAHMLCDPQRGWAWTRAIMEARSPNIHIIGAPFIEPLVTRMVKGVGMEIEKVKHVRLTPLKVIKVPWSLKHLPPRTILVAFSRVTVLALKSELERRHGRSVSVVYGNLPPEVRLNQAERFASGESEICVATDAVGMGLNLPADNVCFFETEKFDGHSQRTLTPNEIRQIGGRAGRYGLSEIGQVGALTKSDLEIVDKAINNPINEYLYGYVSPTLDALSLIPGKLSEKLQRWVMLQDVPTKWKRILRTVDLSQQIELANLLSAEDVENLGEERALKLINAPVYRETENYWYRCAKAIIGGGTMPTPSDPQKNVINSAENLQMFERAIRSADCYLWLSERPEFHRYGLQSERVRARRAHWSMEVDGALQKKVDTSPRCKVCGRPLPIKYRHKICDRCYRSGINNYMVDIWDSD